MIDWSATGTMVSGVGTWAGVAALVWATHKGRQTLADWRRQKALDREMSVAEEVLTASYNLHSEISQMAEGLRSLESMLDEIEKFLSEHEADFPSGTHDKVFRAFMGMHKGPITL